MNTVRQKFLDYVRQVPSARPIVSPFLPKPDLIVKTLQHLGLPVGQDYIENEVRLSKTLDYEPMFMCNGAGLIFPWRRDNDRSDDNFEVSVLSTLDGEWIRKIPLRYGLHGDESAFPVKTEADHEKLAMVCEQVKELESDIRHYFRSFRSQVGEDGVIVIGHPQITWLSGQISQRNMVYHALDYPQTYKRSMDAIYKASLFVFGVAIEEGIDFMSEAGYGLEMISPEQFERQDLHYTSMLAEWTHQQGGLFWYHNCGQTKKLIRSGQFDGLGADVIETIAPPPEGDNDLAESRRYLDSRICSKGNLSLGLLRDGNVEDVVRETRLMVRAVRGYAHIHSTADAVYGETPVENFMAFLQTAREESENFA
jgi:hypothetical protein